MKGKTCEYCLKAINEYGADYEPREELPTRAQCNLHKHRSDNGWKPDEDRFYASPPTPYVAPQKKPVDPESYVAYDTLWKDFMGIRKERKAKVPKGPTGKQVNYGIMGDMHIPFHNEEAVLQSVDWLKKHKTDILYLPGDVADCYSVSRFTQYDSVPIQEEFREARKIIDMLSREFREVRILSGNHEDREAKYLASKLPPEIFQWVYTKSFMQRLTDDMENVHMMSFKIHDTKVTWLTEIGDCSISHPEKNLKIPLRAAQFYKEYIDNWHTTFNMSRPRVVFCAHTHDAGIKPIGPSMIMVETGCLCKIPAYSLTPKMYPKPQVLACTRFTQYDGKTDLNSVRQFYPLQ